MCDKPLVPAGFEVPVGLETGRLRRLTMADAVKDYDAVMSSAERLQAVFREAGHWPTGLTLEQDIMALGWPQTECGRRTSVAYTAVRLDESAVPGCLYIYPAERGGYDALSTEAGQGVGGRRRAG